MDKLTEIMAWKRREVAAVARPVTEAELAGAGIMLAEDRLPLADEVPSP